MSEQQECAAQSASELKREEFWRKLSDDIDRRAGRDLRAIDRFWQAQWRRVHETGAIHDKF